MNELQKILARLGCTEQEIDILIYCLEFGPIGPSAIARNTNITRTTLYGHLHKLSDKGLLKTQDGKHGTTYTTLGADELIAYLQTQKNKFDELIEKTDNIKADILALRKSSTTHKVNYFEGKEVYDHITTKVMQTQEGRYFTNIDAILGLKGWTLQKLISSFKQNTAHIKEIIFESEHQDSYINQLSSKKHEIKVLPVGIEHGLSSDIGMADGFYYHIAFDKQTNAIEVHNEMFYMTHVAIFDALRQRL